MRLREAIVCLLAVSLFSCSGTRPDNLGVQADGQLTPCPSTPNCVSSDADPEDAEHYIEPLRFEGPVEAAWQAAVSALEEMPRTEIVARQSLWLHAQSTSRVFRFVDDVELHLRASGNVIAVRSASRVGRSDIGVNRKRVERLRSLFNDRLRGG